MEEKLVKLTIDGQEVEVPQGTRVIEAAKKANQDIPFYCYHPGLSVAGNCRMCLVEVEGMPKLQISCHMEARDGMVVNTQNDRVKNTRKHVLEFLLVNHPVDCPVCDQAGECWLQDYYLNFAQHDSRVHENKIKKNKAQSIGPTVMLDQERCILCSRCVRFTDEVSKTSELGIINRGDHSEVCTFPGKELDNPYSGNVVDICPVGALTDKDFRFKTRVWYLKSESSVCNGCARGCNIHVQFREGRMHHAKGDRVIRIKPRYNEHVNEWWMSDEGRYGYKYHDHNRIISPLRRKEDGEEVKSYQDLLTELNFLTDESRGQYGVLLSPQLSNEELFLAKKLFVEKWGVEDIHLISPKKDGFEDDILLRADKNPNSKGAELLGFAKDEAKLKALFEKCESGEVKGLILFGQDLIDLYGREMKEKVFDNLEWCAFFGSNHNTSSAFATHLFPSATHFEKEGTFTNFEGRIQKFNQVFLPLGESQADWKALLELAAISDLKWPYQREEDIFDEMVLTLEAFKELTYEKLGEDGSDVRQFAAPMIPQYMQDAGLIFGKEEEKEEEPVA